ncbi:glycosyltransferase involved in cell wall biosynthesis [Lysinibacillus composti]|uniref:Glycosyltransferase family 1 protein n=1 Tax=Lysinibacillus composti TaxID=720633 RepID=A0A3N9UPH9_9BACI|nr:glycosyltransferase family 4 protein [Lysinibacillus composti]MBM7610253.1 glycosyltransferase involved in cell wall biosynthesis [Lysinibacillus composti]RQW73826.1 glycosyltransferase family 1 protein [Lysinibacillus composti]
MKILYVTTISNTMGFFTNHINMLLDQGHTVDLACNLIKPINPELLERGCNVYPLPFLRSPLKRGNYRAYKELNTLIRSGKYDLVHTHTPIASAGVRLACRNLNNVKVIYTAHGFHFYKGAPLKNWLTYYPVEHYLSRFTDLIITINKEDYDRAKSFKAKSVKYIPGVGLDIKKFENIDINKSIKRNDLKVPEDSFVAISVGELNGNKNHEVVIRAIAELKNPNIHYMICGVGPKEEYLRKLVKDLDLEGQIKLLGYRRDIGELLKVSDIFVFPSFREGLSVALMEAMACGLPVICSNIRGNRDLIINEKGGYLVNPKKIVSFSQAILETYENANLRERMGIYNREKIKYFTIDVVKEEIKDVYNDFKKELEQN